MMQNPHPAKRRVIALLAFFGAFLLLFAAVLYDAQILHGGENRAKSISSNAASETVTASRGIITDRNGKVLVSNRLAYTLVFDRSGFDDDAALNAAILRLVQLCEETGTGWNDTLPIGRVGNFLRYSNARSETFDKFIEKNDLTSGASGRQLLSELRELYHVDESLSEREARLIVGVRYELHSRDSYTFAEDVSTEVLSLITDGRYEGVTIRTASARVYNTALAETISGMIDKDSNERGGAAAVVSVGTGEVLALASYPTYDLSTFNEDYDELVNDQRLPMFNRATQGIYAPGSTFKMVTAVAALESGIITPSSIIQDRGIYTYYKDPQPMCWIYSQTGSTHGRINVSQAITDSCNYFFYEVGRLTGIRTLDSYASQFGLGQSTGIEIGDSSGVLASPEWAESHDQEWTDGQTITAAIGQSYNLFTPLQLANYVATLVGGGDHYQAHLLKNVKAYDNSRLLYMYDDEPMNTVEISDSTLSSVTRGMHELTVSGSVAYAFENCVVSAGAKTGSAQVGTDIANGVFVAYAPYEKPEIAVAIVIEKGGSGAALANTAVEIINSWFSRAQDGTAIGENTLLK